MDRKILGENEVQVLVRVVRALGGMWTENDLCDPADLQRHCYKFLHVIFFVFVVMDPQNGMSC